MAGGEQTPDPRQDYSGAVLFIATHALYDDLLSAHQPDRSGRCRVCDTDSWRGDWPCLTHLIATEARELARRWEGAVPEQRGSDERTAERGAGPLVAPPPESSGDQG